MEQPRAARMWATEREVELVASGVRASWLPGGGFYKRGARQQQLSRGYTERERRLCLSMSPCCGFEVAAMQGAMRETWWFVSYSCGPG